VDSLGNEKLLPFPPADILRLEHASMTYHLLKEVAPERRRAHPDQKKRPLEDQRRPNEDHKRKRAFSALVQAYLSWYKTDMKI
jgi:hypothetical protein